VSLDLLDLMVKMRNDFLKIFRDLYQYTISQPIKRATKMRTGNSSVQVSPKIIFAKRIKQVRSVWYDIRIFL